MLRCAVFVLTAALFAAAPLTAGDAKTKKPLGTWTRTASDVEVKFHFESDTLKCNLSGLGIIIDIDADYGMSKDGYVFGRISKIDKKGACVGPKVGDLFVFRVQVKGDTLTISNLGPNDDADARQLIEGDYKKK
jgi:hypothetical protein